MPCEHGSSPGWCHICATDTTDDEPEMTDESKAAYAGFASVPMWKRALES